jgi:hypothetical protein
LTSELLVIPQCCLALADILLIENGCRDQRSQAKGVAFRIKFKTAIGEFILDRFSSCRNG